MITLWGRKSSINVQKVTWTLAELGLAYEHKNVGGDQGGLNTPEFLKLNPQGLIPVLQDDDLTIWESHAIVRYLCAKYAENNLWFTDPAKQSLSERWVDWTITTLQPYYLGLFWMFFRMPPEKRKQKEITATVNQCEKKFALLDNHLAHQPYLAGNQFTMADIPAGSLLYRYFEMGLDVSRPPHLMQWYERLAERDAYQKTIMTSFEELRAKTGP
jgi:glutathione S-transferase